MGLSISVGSLAGELASSGADPEHLEHLRSEIRAINALLLANDLPEHHEPETLPNDPLRADYLGFSYSRLHYLRRIYARAAEDKTWDPVPCPDGENPARDKAIDDQSSMLSSHLLCHSDCEGYYVPIDFGEPLFAANQNAFAGAGILGSSQGLMRELIFVAPYLGIRLTASGILSDAEADAINTRINGSDPFERELLVWIALFEACRISIRYKTLIRFC